MTTPVRGFYTGDTTYVMFRDSQKFAFDHNNYPWTSECEDACRAVYDSYTSDLPRHDFLWWTLKPLIPKKTVKAHRDALSPVKAVTVTPDSDYEDATIALSDRIVKEYREYLSLDRLEEWWQKYFESNNLWPDEAADYSGACIQIITALDKKTLWKCFNDCADIP